MAALQGGLALVLAVLAVVPDLGVQARRMGLKVRQMDQTETEPELKKDIVISLKKGASDQDIEAICKGRPCEMAGHPSEGGIPFIKVHGTDEEVQAVMDAAGDKVESEEPDMKISIPELPNDPDSPVLVQTTDSDTPKKDVIVILKRGTSDEDIESICQGEPCQLKGHPSEGGMPFVKVHGTDDEVQAVLDAAGDKVESEEPDEEVSMIPELPADPEAPVLMQSAPVKDIIITLKKGASDQDIKAICKDKPCESAGHPSEGGIPFIKVHGTDEEVQAVMDAAGDKVESEEPDQEMSIIPEMPNDPDVPVLVQDSAGHE